MNSVVTRSAAAGAIASLGNLKSGLQNVQSTIKGTASDPFLRLLTDGVWVYGAENIEVEEGSIWAVNPLSIMHGYIAWTDRPGKQQNEVVGEVMVPMTQPLPHELPELPDATAKWAQQITMLLRCTNGADTGEQVLYKATSIGGLNAVRSLIGQIIGQLDADPEHPVPLLDLAVDSYQHKKFGKTYVPVFNVTAWADMEGVENEAEEAEDGRDEGEAEDTAPATERRQTAAAAPARGPVTAADRRSAMASVISDLQKDAGQDDAPASNAPEPRRRRRA